MYFEPLLSETVTLTDGYTPPSLSSQVVLSDAFRGSDDPYFNNVSLLLPLNSLYAFKDYSVNPRTITVNGNTTISAAQSKWGNGSSYFDGSGDYITTPYTSDFDWWLTDYTIEMWVYPLNYGRQIPYLIGKIQGINNFWSFGLDNLNRVAFYFHGGTGVKYTSQVMPLNAWSHIAMTKTSEGFYLWANGVRSGPWSTSGAYSSTSAPLSMGVYDSSSYNGHIQDLRVTKGVARYTANFTPPIKEFSGLQNLFNIQNYGTVPNTLKTHNPLKFFGASVGILQDPLSKICDPAKVIGSVALTQTYLKSFDSLNVPGYPVGKQVTCLKATCDREDGGAYYVDGYITIKNSPASRKVRLYSLNNHRLIQQVWSHPVTGYYKFSALKNQEYFVWSEDYERVYDPVTEIVTDLKS
jgi:hypothetical protein